MQQHTQHNPEQIASAAYCLWEKAGRPTGRDVEFWLKAERQLQVAGESRPKLGSQPGAPGQTTTSNELKARQPIPDAIRQVAPPAAHIVPPREKRPSPSVAARAR